MTTDAFPVPGSSAVRPPGVLSGRAASIALFVVLFASFMDLLDVTIVAVAAPAISADLGATASELQWMVAAYVLALGSGLITGGRIGDQYGRRRIFQENRQGQHEGLLRDGSDTARAADLLWLLSSFSSFDLLATVRGRTPENIAHMYLATLTHTVLRSR